MRVTRSLEPAHSRSRAAGTAILPMAVPFIFCRTLAPAGRLCYNNLRNPIIHLEGAGGLFLRRVLVKYWITYISITLFTILAMVPIYLQTYDNVKTQQLRDTEVLLESRFAALSAEYNSMQHMVKSLQADRTFVLLSNWSGRADRINLYHYIKFQETLQQTVTPSNLALDVYVLFGDSPYVVSKRASAMTRADFYARELSYPAMDFAAWQDALWQEQRVVLPYQPVRYFQLFSTNAVTFLYYTGVSGDPSSVIAVVVDEAKLLGLLMTEEIRSDGLLRLELAGRDSGENIALYAYEADGIGAQSRLNYFGPIEGANGLKLTAAIHERVYAEATRNVRNTMLLYIGIALLVSLVLSGAYTINVYLPVRHTWAQMRREGLAPESEKSFHKLMSVSMAGLLTRKQDLEASLADISRKHRDQLMTNLLYGMAVPQREIDAVLGPLPMLRGPYVFLRLTIRPEKEAGTAAGTPADVTEVYDAMDRMLAAVFQQAYLPVAGRSAIIGLQNADIEAVCVRLEAIAASIHAAHACQAMFAVSRALEGVDALREGWAEASQLLRFADVAEGAILRMEQMHALFTRYDLIMFQPEILLSQVAQSDARALAAYIDTLLGQLTMLHFARPRRAEQLYYNISDACQAALRKYGLPDEAIPDYNAAQDILLTTEALREAIMAANGRIQMSRQEAQPKRETVLDYIRAHFTDPNLSLTELAEAFHYSEGYIYQIIKKQTGLSYADYVNGLRMERASNLLLESDLATVDVAQQSGFHTLNTFYKAFKKKYGMAPKAYREQAKKPPVP